MQPRAGYRGMRRDLTDMNLTSPQPPEGIVSQAARLLKGSSERSSRCSSY